MKTDTKETGIIRNIAELKQKVQELELLRLEKEELIKNDALSLLEQARPINIAKRMVVKSSLVKNTFQSKGIGGKLLQAGMAFMLRRIFRKTV